MARFSTSPAVATVRTTSTSFITGAGLKKWSPMTRSGRSVTEARSTTGRDDVVVARIASGFVERSSSRKIASLTARSSATASTTRSTSAMSANSSVVVIRSRTRSASSRSIFPFVTARSRLLATAPFARLMEASLRPRRMTSLPAFAATSAMPDAIRPVPTTPTVPTSDVATPDSSGIASTTFDDSGASYL
jgi:hypothetical protein